MNFAYLLMLQQRGIQFIPSDKPDPYLESREHSNLFDDSSDEVIVKFGEVHVFFVVDINESLLVWEGEPSLAVPFPLAPFDVVAQGFAFPLGKGAGPCEEYLAGHTRGVQPFFFKPDNNTPVLQHPYV